MNIWFVVAYSILGAVVGSFLNVCADRLPTGDSIVTPPSHCPHCGRELGALELIPIASFLILRGKCKACGHKIGWRSPLIELFTALLFGVIFVRFGPSLKTLWVTADACFLMVMAVTDIEGQRILNVVVLPALVIALLAAAVRTDLSLLQSLAGAGVGFVILFLLAIIIPGGMGMGDVKLGAYIGLIVGFPLIALALIAAFVLGGAVAGSLWAAGVLSRGDRIAFGPYLAAAGLVGLLFGTDLVTLWTSRLA